MSSENYLESNHSVDEQDQLINREPRRASTSNPNLAQQEDISICEAMKDLLFASLPYAGSSLLNSSGRIITYIILKTYNNDTLTGAYGISSNFMNVLSSAIFLALNIGLLARISPAYGAKHYKMIGYYLHRAFIIRFTIYLMVATIFFFSYNLFILIGYNQELAEDVGTFLKFSIPGLFFYLIFFTFNYYLMGMKIFFPGAIILIIGTFIFIIFAYIFMIKLMMGIKGAALAQDISFFGMAALLVSYIFIKNPVDQTLFWFDKASFNIQEIWEQFTSEIAVGSMVSVKLMSTEIVGIMSGYLNQIQMAAYQVTLACMLTFYGIEYSLISALISFIGGSVGQEKVMRAKSYFKAGLVLTLCELLICIAILTIFAQQIANSLLPNSEDVVVAIVLLHIFCLLIVIDFSQLSIGAALRILGEQKAGTICILISMFGIGIPMAYVLGFVLNEGAEGLVWGLGTGYLATLIGYLWIYSKLDWNTQTKVVKENLEGDCARAGIDDASDQEILATEGCNLAQSQNEKD